MDTACNDNPRLCIFFYEGFGIVQKVVVGRIFHVNIEPVSDVLCAQNKVVGEFLGICLVKAKRLVIRATGIFIAVKKTCGRVFLEKRSFCQIVD